MTHSITSPDRSLSAMVVTITFSPARVGRQTTRESSIVARGGARLSVHHRPPVDVPRLPGDVVALLGREEQRQARDVVGTSDATGGRQRQHRGGRVALGERALAPRGRFAPARVDAAGADGVDRDAVRRQLLGHDLGEADHAELRRRVGAAPGGAALARHRGHVDDPPAVARQHVRDHGAAHQERALEIDIDDEVPRLLWHLPEQATIGTVRGGGVVDEHIDAAEPREGVRDEALRVGRAAHVADHREGTTPEALDLPGQALEALPPEPYFREPLLVLVPRPAGRHVRHDDIGARAGERDGNRAPHPLRPRTSVTSTIVPSNSLTGRTPLLDDHARLSEQYIFVAMEAQDECSVPSHLTPSRGPLTGIRVIELADEQAEYCGLTLAGLGADVVKVEPPGGSPTRRIGPFYQDREDRERSLFFWQYNRGKRSIVLDLRRPEDRDRFRSLVATADVLLESTPRGELDGCGLSANMLMQQSPTLIVSRMSPFGDHGPWADFKGSDLVHLALGGVMMNCGYDPAPGGTYDLPPIAPQMWHAFHIAGEQLAMAIIAALLFRWRTGKGQYLSCAIHEAVAKSTEVDLMSWVMRRVLVLRQTCRHARETVSPHPSIVHTKDGRWVMANLGTRPGESAALVGLLERYGMAAGLDTKQSVVAHGSRFVPGTAPTTEKRDHAMEAVQRFVRAFTYENVPWREAQEAGMLWAPLRKPHENAMDPHWLARQSCTDVEHPELGRTFRYATSKWLATGTSWSVGRRAPLLNEDAASVTAERAPDLPVVASDARPVADEKLSPR